MDIRKVKKLIDLLEQSNLAEIEIKEGEESVRISRYSAVIAESAARQVDMQKSNIQHADEPQITKTSQQQKNETTSSRESLTAPMVGTFYKATSPNSDPFVNIGQNIQKGDIICIIEAMKIMNQIEADKSGKVVDILVKDGDSVEFGQTLMVIE